MMSVPRFKKGDAVKFQLDGKTYLGIVEVVDANGTFFNPGAPSYDITTIYEGELTLVKHIGERGVVAAR